MPISPALLSIMQRHRAEGWALRRIAAQMNALGLKTSRDLAGMPPPSGLVCRIRVTFSGV